MRDDPERRKKGQLVSEPSMEVGIKVNNVLTALVIAVMLWVGTSVTTIKESISDLSIGFAAAQVKVEYLAAELDEQKLVLRKHIDKHGN